MYYLLYNLWIHEFYFLSNLNFLIFEIWKMKNIKKKKKKKETFQLNLTLLLLPKQVQLTHQYWIPIKLKTKAHALYLSRPPTWLSIIYLYNSFYSINISTNSILFWIYYNPKPYFSQKYIITNNSIYWW